MNALLDSSRVGTSLTVIQSNLEKAFGLIPTFLHLDIETLNVPREFLNAWLSRITLLHSDTSRCVLGALKF